MPMTERQYREHLYSKRTHPAGVGSIVRPPDTEAFTGLYWTLLPFLVGEYLAELRFDTLPSGMVFPTAYLLFWAFYFTYCRPGSLETRLASPKKWDLFGLPTIMMGISIWFVKVAVVEFTDLLVSSLIPKARARVYHYPPRQGGQPGNGHRHTAYTKHQSTPPIKPPAFPVEIENALGVLGLHGCKEWRTIQKRYRDLAKRYHPDLNKELTVSGNRFMIYDAAYRRLLVVRDRYFS